MEKLLKSFISNAIEKLAKAKTKLDNNAVASITINATFFDKKFMKDVNISEYLATFKVLKKQNKPTLYWFELKSSTNNTSIRKEYEEYRTKTKNAKVTYRNTAAYKTESSATSTTLYVGKVETNFWGRLVTHLGYSRSEKTAGMQLFHWYDIAEFGELKLNYIQFDNEMKHLISILEKELAIALKPLIGRY